MSAVVIDGKKVAEELRGSLRGRVTAFTEKHGRPPGLDVVLVGEDPASVVYTRNKEKAAAELGMRSALHRMPAETTKEDLLTKLASLNADDAVDGILVQLPLPKHMPEVTVLDAVRADKDVDGFHPQNVGLLASGRPFLVPCTPKGCMHLLRSVGAKLAGARAVVIGRSNIVGKPMAQLLLAESATVTIAHSKTQDLSALCREADIVVAAVGRPEFVRGDWVKPGAIVIDVGINRIEAPELGAGKTRLVGDVCYREAFEVASFITPVPGGVGPMTIACLLENTLIAAERRASHPDA